MIDGTYIRAHRHAAGALSGQQNEGLGRSCGGFSSKLHVKVDANGRPLCAIVTAGNCSDISQADELVRNGICKSLLADRGYDSDAFRHGLSEQGILPIIPGRKNRLKPIIYDIELYKKRNAVERFFGRLKEFRRIATRYDKTVVMFRGMLTMAFILIWLKV